MEKKSINITNIDKVKTKNSGIQNRMIHILGGAGVEIKKVVETKDAVEILKDNKKSVVSEPKLGCDIDKDNTNEDGKIVKKNVLTNNERILLMFLLSVHTLNDKEIKEIEINETAAKSLFCNKDEGLKDYYRILKKTARMLFNRQFSYFNGIDKIESPLLMRASNIDLKIIDGPNVKLKLNPDLAMFFLANKKEGHYTKLVFLDFMNVNVKNQALYLVLKRDQGLSMYRNRYNTPLYYSKAYIKALFNSKYKSFSTFNEKFLKQAIKDINENSDVNVEYHICRSKEREENSTISMAAEVYFKIVKKTEDFNKLTFLRQAKDKVIAKGKYVKEFKMWLKMKDFKIHPVIDNHFILTLETENGDVFDTTVTYEDMFQDFKKIIKEEYERTVKKADAEIPGAGSFFNQLEI